ncbi:MULTISPECIES: hypothetical protein [unclassified Paenibacillus]|uniref:hypothetical protein n=1 Tax=unclassified Paenibacillus TaxID=185978 RepID=UPI00311A301E
MFNTNTLRVRRNGTIIIFTTTFGVAISRENEAFGFSAADVPPAAIVATGQIQYTVEIFTNAAATDTLITFRRETSAELPHQNRRKLLSNFQFNSKSRQSA